MPKKKKNIRLPLIVIFTRAACESAHNIGCGPLPKNVDAPAPGYANIMLTN
jgi:hypothetical protein